MDLLTLAVKRERSLFDLCVSSWMFVEGGRRWELLGSLFGMLDEDP